MKNKLIVNRIEKTNNIIKLNYELEGLWKEVLYEKEKFWCEYQCNVEKVPNSIAIIPFLANIIPIMWVFGLEVEINEVDKIFYDELKNIKKGYQEMYPQIELKGKLKINKIIENKYETYKKAVLFSGGVDAWNTLINHIDEKPDFITIWGADIKLDDVAGWNLVFKNHEKIAKEYNLKFNFIKSNFRSFLNESKLTQKLNEYIKGNWWHEMQHGIGIISLVSALSYIEGYKTVYIASTYTKEDIGKYTCASDPTIDNQFKYANTQTIHDGYEFSRQDKIKNICEYVNKNSKNINLRVCWISKGGKNCCECEKCYRTILGILAEKSDPNKFGFIFKESDIKIIKKKMYLYYKYNYSSFYNCILKRFKENYTDKEIPKELRWFRNVKMKDKRPEIIIFIGKIYRKMQKVLKIK